MGGCCRFRNWRAKHMGSMTADKCVSLCLANADCTAADITRQSSTMHMCWHFFGDPFQNFVLQCDTRSKTKFCYPAKGCLRSRDPCLELSTLVTPSLSTEAPGLVMHSSLLHRL